MEPKLVDDPGEALRRTAAELSRWLVNQGLAERGLRPLAAGLGARVRSAGIPVVRLHLTTRTLHPNIQARSHTWIRDAGAASDEHEYGDTDSEAWLRSPLRVLLESDQTILRCRISEGETQYPVFEEFRELGGTDYLGQKVLFGIDGGTLNILGVLISWVSDRPGGFSDTDLVLLKGIAPTLGLAVKSTLGGEITRNLLDTYVGAHAGEKILSGAIRRGTVEAISCAGVMFTDLRDFTAMTDRIEQQALPEMLNAYFDAMVGPVLSAGGQVLKYLGDGFLAVFGMATDREGAGCARGLDAARTILDNVRELNVERGAAGLPVMELDIALHLGDVLYGNVGSANRLDFTVIGPAVNEASRIEAMCKRLGKTLLMSEDFVRVLPDATAVVSVGRHRLRGVEREQELFSVARTLSQGEEKSA